MPTIFETYESTTTILETSFGNIQIKRFYLDNNVICYDVYTEPNREELYGKYIGEFYPTIIWNDDMDKYEEMIFISELEDFIYENY